MACPFAKLSINGGGKTCPVAKTGKKPPETAIVDETPRAQLESENGGGASKCPSGFDKNPSANEPEAASAVAGQCPFGYGKEDRESEDKSEKGSKDRKEETIEAAAGGKCPLGYDSVSFKIGPFSCVLCRALLYDSSRCVPCRHIFCRFVLSSYSQFS